MAIAVKDNTSFAVEIETVEGTYVAPQSDASYVQVLKDGSEMTRTQETLNREVFTGSIGKTQSRLGMKSVSGSMPVEMRASSTPGAAPEFDKLMTSAMGAKKTRAAVTTATGHTTSRIYIEDADISDFSANDIIQINEVGAFSMNFILSVDTTPGSAFVTLGVLLASTPSDNVVIQPVTQYSTANSGHPSLSISKYIEAVKLEQAAGCKVTSFSLENFTTGQIPSISFGFEGLSFDSSLTASPFTPDYDDALPPIALRACLHQNGVDIQVNNFTVSAENTLGFVTSTCSANGRISSRVTERSISGTFNPYKDDDSLTQFENFKCNTPYTLFVYAFNPTLDGNCEWTGEWEQGYAMLLTNCITLELGESDQDGLLVEDISFEATRGPKGTDEEMKIAFF